MQECANKNHDPANFHFHFTRLTTNVVAVAQDHCRINATENHPIPYHTVQYDAITCNNMQYDSSLER